VLFIMHEITIQDLNNVCPDGGCPNATVLKQKQPEIDRAATYYWAGWITLGVGVVGLGTGLTMLVLDNKAQQAESARVHFVPAAPGALAGASLAGHF
jgi:hypothetical protein